MSLKTFTFATKNDNNYRRILNRPPFFGAGDYLMKI